MKSYAAIALAIFSFPALADYNFTTPFDGRIVLEKQISEESNPWQYQGAAGFVPLSGGLGWRFRQGKNYAPLVPQSFGDAPGWSIVNANNRLGFWKVFQGHSNVYEIAFGNTACREPEEEAEVDLFLDPAGTPTGNMYLSDIGELRLDVGYIATQMLKEPGCSVTRSTAISSVYLKDTATGKTLALQINLGGTDGSKIEYHPYNWNKGKDPGIDDYVSNYGGAYVQGVGASSNTVDLLPRIIWLIQSGAARGSLDVRNWYISGFNVGVISYGKVNVSTNWHDVGFSAKGGAFCSGTTRTQYICSAPVAPSNWGIPQNGCYHRPTNIQC